MAYGTMEFNDAGEIRNCLRDWTATFGALLAENPDVAARMHNVPLAVSNNSS